MVVIICNSMSSVELAPLFLVWTIVLKKVNHVIVNHLFLCVSVCDSPKLDLQSILFVHSVIFHHSPLVKRWTKGLWWNIKVVHCTSVQFWGTFTGYTLHENFLLLHYIYLLSKYLLNRLRLWIKSYELINKMWFIHSVYFGPRIQFKFGTKQSYKN